VPIANTPKPLINPLSADPPFILYDTVVHGVPVIVTIPELPEQILEPPLMPAVSVTIETTALPVAAYVHVPLETFTNWYVVFAFNGPEMSTAVPEPLRVMVWLAPPLMVYVTIAPGVPVKEMLVEDPLQIEAVPFIEATRSTIVTLDVVDVKLPQRVELVSETMQ
jgi:hypothetical protein